MDKLGIGQRIRDLRGYESLPSFAKKIDVSKSTLMRYENETSYPDAKTMLRICVEYSVNPNWLLTGEGPKTVPDPPVGYNAAHNLLRESIARRLLSVGQALSHTAYIDEVLSEEAYRQYCRDCMEKKGGLKTWGRELAFSTIDAYLKGTYLPSDAELWAICRAASYPDFDSLKSGRNTGIQLEKEATEGFVRLKTTVTDSDLLKEVIETIEKISIEHDIALSIEKKSEIIIILYEEMFADPQGRIALKEKAERLFKLAI